MPGINVAALSEGDLRRLLKVAHARADGLLADRLEWEIAARASSVVRPAGPFATLADDPDEAAEHLAAYPDQSFAPEHAARHPVSGRKSGVLLVSLGAIAGSLLSATVFWSIERLPVLDRARPHPTRAMAMRSAPPVQPEPELAVAQVTPEALPPLPAPIVVDTPAPTPPPVEVAKVTPPVKPVVVEVAKAATPAKPVVVKTISKTPVEPRKPAAAKTQVVANKAPPKRELAQKEEPAVKQQAALKTGSPTRPPTLAEWLAKSEPAPRQQ